MTGEVSFKCDCGNETIIWMKSKLDWPFCCGKQMERLYVPLMLNVSNGTKKDINQREGMRKAVKSL